jgi:hypothetical protein
MVSGEAGPEERDAFAAHLGACPRCAVRLGKTLALARELSATLAGEVDRLGTTPHRLDLPERPPAVAGGRRFTSILVDLSLLLVIGLGLFLLVAVLILGYRSAVRHGDRVRRFQAVHDVLWLEHAGTRILRQKPAMTRDELASRLRLPAGRGRGPAGPRDPWGNVYVIRREDGTCAAWSCGPNGENEDGGGDDVTARSEVPALGRPPRAPGAPRR